MDEKGLGKQLQAARQAAGLTQQQLCQRANLSFSTLTKIERGAIRSPSIFTIQAIATALDQSLDQLVGHSPARATPRTLWQSKSGVSFVYFDVNGCLIQYFERAFGLIAADYNIPAESVEMAHWHFNNDICKGTMSLDDFNRKFAGRIGVPEIVWQDYYLKAIEPIEAMQELLLWTSQHYRIGLLTNIMPGILPAIRRAGLLPDLAYDAVIDSSAVGAIKPETKIYDIAQAQANCRADQIMFIDDSRANLIAAETVGWHVMLCNDAQVDASVEKIRQALEPATAA